MTQAFLLNNLKNGPKVLNIYFLEEHKLKYAKSYSMTISIPHINESSSISSFFYVLSH